MGKPTKEYYLAKADLCANLAIKQAEEGEIGLALANLLRMENVFQALRAEEEGK